jgi:hypothetical protein
VQGYQGVPPIQGVPMPGHPAGVSPNLTQYPTAPPGGFNGPTIQVVPGPATVAPGGGPLGPGGVAGVQMAPVSSVAPPVVTGGPHPLPPFPSFPVPQGFPNPFAAVGGPQGGAPGWPAETPYGLGAVPQGMQSMTGPQGFFPGIGWVGIPGGAMPPGGGPPLAVPPGAAYPMTAPTAAAFPYPGASGPVSLGGHIPGAPGIGGPAPVGTVPLPPPGTLQSSVPVTLGAQPPAEEPLVQAAGAAFPTAPVETGEPGPFWLHLGWQLLQTPAVRAAFGSLFDELVRGNDRLRTIQTAAKALTSPELQQAFRAVTAGQMEQGAFTQLFADRLNAAMKSRD